MEEQSTTAESQTRLIPFATKTMPSGPQLYQVVDFLNKNLQEHGLMFGLTKDMQSDSMTISIYRV